MVDKAIEEELTVIDNTLSLKVEYVDVPLWTKSISKRTVWSICPLLFMADVSF